MGTRAENEAKFATLAVNEIARDVGREAVIKICTPRSGAKILAALQTDVSTRFVFDPDIVSFFDIRVIKVAEHKSTHVRLPSGRQLKVPKGDREKFYDIYPMFFSNDEQVIAFFDGLNEEPARRLLGENPATFPTITYQVERVDDRVAESINLVLMDGSVNDVDFEEVLDSLDGPEIEKIDVAIRLFSFEALKMLVTNARGKFPNAVILVTGYYSPFSKDSNHGRLEELAKYMSGKPGWQLAANDFLTSLWGKILTHGFFELIGATKDVDELVAEAIHRSEFAHSRGLYWMRRAVTELNESGQRGPGLYFVHPGFRPENSLFASTPFLHQGYKSPDEASDRHTVHDAALDERRRQIPRFELLSELKEARRTLAPINLVLSRPSGISLPVLPNKEDFVTLLSKLDGPISLRDQLSEIIEGPVTRKRVRGVMDALDSEIGRIKHAWIASFVHPNEAGARRYADAIVDRYKRHRQFSLRSDLTRLAATDQQASSNIVSVHRTLNRYGFDPRYGLRSCLEHMIVDSIAVEMTMKSLFPDIPVFDPQELTRMFLGIGNGKRWRLQNPFGKLNTIDTFGTLRLDDIEQLALEVDEGIAELRDFKLIINGKAVFHSSQNTPLESGDRLMFAYPA